MEWRRLKVGVLRGETPSAKREDSLILTINDSNEIARDYSRVYGCLVQSEFIYFTSEQLSR